MEHSSKKYIQKNINLQLSHIVLVLMSLVWRAKGQFWDCYNDYCFFTYGFNVTVSCLNLAKHMCLSDLKNSHPIEVTNERTLKEVSEFIEKYIPNLKVILNAHLIAEGTYYWKHNNKLVDIDLRQKQTDDLYCMEQLYIYRSEILCAKEGEMPKYGVICMIDCPVRWSRTELLPETEHTHHNITLKKDCLQICLSVQMCRGYVYGKHKRRTICQTGVTSSVSIRKIKGVFFYKRLQTSYSSCTNQLKVKQPPNVFGSCNFAFTPVSLRLVVYSMVFVLLINLILFGMLITNSVSRLRRNLEESWRLSRN